MLRVFRALEDAAGVFPPSALTIGNFDGVHIGHQAIFRRVVEAARRSGAKASVLTFDPHPSRVVAPERAPSLLSTIDQRCAWIDAAGMEQVLVLPFNRQIAGFSPEQFIDRVVIDCLGARVVFVGQNFRFGHRAAGDTNALIELGRRRGFDVVVVEPVRCRGRIVSSSQIRELIRCGRVSDAARYLGRPYGLTGDVVPGHGVGLRQTVPTLNLSTSAEILPARGVYVTRTTDLTDNRRWPSVTNVGYRPTFGGERLTVETFLLVPLDAPQPVQIRVDFWRRLREERKFENSEALKAQILKDASRALRWHQRAERFIKRGLY